MAIMMEGYWGDLNKFDLIRSSRIVLMAWINQIFGESSDNLCRFMKELRRRVVVI